MPSRIAVETVRRWHETGHFIHITGHRAVEAHGATARWLARVGIPCDDLHCSCDKVTRCVALGIGVLVDDSPVNLVRARERGITGATIRHCGTPSCAAARGSSAPTTGAISARRWNRGCATGYPQRGLHPSA